MRRRRLAAMLPPITIGVVASVPTARATCGVAPASVVSPLKSKPATVTTESPRRKRAIWASRMVENAAAQVGA